MKISFERGRWVIQRDEVAEDLLTRRFINVLERHKVRYVLVSGYVSILFGRSRHSEDIDIFIESLEFREFEKLWQSLLAEFDSVTISDEKKVFYDYLRQGTSVRLAEKGKIIPNVELRFPNEELDEWTLDNAITAVLNGNELRISPLELQIAYKLRLGSDKDFEDARHLWIICRDNLNHTSLNGFAVRFGQEKNARRWLN